MHCLQVRGPYEMEEKIRVRLPNIYKIRKIGIVQPHKKSVPMAAYHNGALLIKEKEKLEQEYNSYYIGDENSERAKDIRSRLNGINEFLTHRNSQTPNAIIYIDGIEYAIGDNDTLEFDNLYTSNLNIKWLGKVNAQAIIDIIYEDIDD